MRWIVLLVLGALLVTIWAHAPLRPDTDLAATDRRNLETRFRTTLRDLDLAEAAYRETARADSILHLLPAEPGLIVALSPALAREVADTVHAVAAREFAAVRPSRARIGVFVIDVVYGYRSTLRPPANSRLDREVYFGADSTGAYCASITTGSLQRDGVLATPAFGYGLNAAYQARDATPNALGPCAFVARHGAPGAHIAEWLEAGAWTFAELRDPPMLDDTTTARLLWWSWYEETNALRACGAGRPELCRQLLFPEPATAPAGPGFDLFPYPRRTATAALLFELEQEFGPERFAEFWTSSDSVTTAFASAFDTDPLVWMRDWTRGHYQLASLGPLVDPGNLLLSLGVVVLLAGIAVLVATRREV